jgi:hypothetical protein
VAVIVADIPSPPRDEEFWWIRPPAAEDELSYGTWYVDGSLLDGHANHLGRLGVGLVVVGAKGRLLAVAGGVPPDWVRTIPAAEAWAILLALQLDVNPRAIWSDCLSCVKVVKAGAYSATSPQRQLARIFAALFTAADQLEQDELARLLRWMPAHTTERTSRITQCSDGQLLTALSRRANALADLAAKSAARKYRVTKVVRDSVFCQTAAIVRGIASVGVATAAANAHEVRCVEAETGTVTVQLRRDSTALAWQQHRTATTRRNKQTAQREHFRPREMKLGLRRYCSVDGKSGTRQAASRRLQHSRGKHDAVKKRAAVRRRRMVLAREEATERDTIAKIRLAAGPPAARHPGDVNVNQWRSAESVSPAARLVHCKRLTAASACFTSADVPTTSNIGRNHLAVDETPSGTAGTNECGAVLHRVGTATGSTYQRPVKAARREACSRDIGGAMMRLMGRS